MQKTAGDYFEFQYKDKMSWQQCKTYIQQGMNYKGLAEALGISNRRAFDWWHKAKREIDSE